MNSYLLIESRSDQESPDVPALRDVATGLRAAGHEVTVFLLQNAVITAAVEPSIENLAETGVTVWADHFSVEARGLAGLPRPPGLRVGGMPDLVRLLMAPGTVAVWH
jgi:sulfur transfer complex TusBCD TusB component (DsrH family)